MCPALICRTIGWWIWGFVANHRPSVVKYSKDWRAVHPVLLAIKWRISPVLNWLSFSLLQMLSFSVPSWQLCWCRWCILTDQYSLYSILLSFPIFATRCHSLDLQNPNSIQQTSHVLFIAQFKQDQKCIGLSPLTARIVSEIGSHGTHLKGHYLASLYL